MVEVLRMAAPWGLAILSSTFQKPLSPAISPSNRLSDFNQDYALIKSLVDFWSPAPAPSVRPKGHLRKLPLPSDAARRHPGADTSSDRLLQLR